MKNKRKRKSIYWKAELLARAIAKSLLILAGIGWSWAGLWFVYLMVTR